MLIEPTESRASLARLFIAALRDLAMAAKRGEATRFSGAPIMRRAGVLMRLAPPARRCCVGPAPPLGEAADNFSPLPLWERCPSEARRVRGICEANPHPVSQLRVQPTLSHKGEGTVDASWCPRLVSTAPCSSAPEVPKPRPACDVTEAGPCEVVATIESSSPQTS